MRASTRTTRAFDELTDGGRVRRYRRVASEALAAYGLARARIVPVREGECMIFRVEQDGARYALRIHNPGYQTEASVRSELVWLRSLRDRGVAVPEPTPTVDGDLLVVAEAPGIDGSRVCDLLRWQDGRFSDRPLGEGRLRELGRLLATMHDHASSFEPPPSFTRQRWDGEHVFGRTIDEALRAVDPHLTASERDVVRRVIQRDREVRAALGESRRTVGLIHADLTQGNLLLHRDGIRAIDFDDLGFGHFLYDIAVSLSRSYAAPDFAWRRATLLQGYRAVRALPEEHEAHIPALIAARRFSLMAWKVLRWGDPDIAGYVVELEHLVSPTSAATGGTS